MYNSKLQLERILKTKDNDKDLKKELKAFIELGYIPLSVESNGMLILFKPGADNSYGDGSIGFFLSGDTDNGFFIPFDKTGNLFKLLITKEIYGTLNPLVHPKLGAELDSQIKKLKKDKEMVPEEKEALLLRLENDKKIEPIIKNELIDGFKYIMVNSMHIPNKDLSELDLLHNFLLAKDLENSVCVKILTVLSNKDKNETKGIVQLDISRLVIQQLMSCWASYEDSIGEKGYITPEQREELGLYTELEEWLMEVTGMHPSRFTEKINHENKEYSVLSDDGQTALSKTQFFQKGLLDDYKKYLTNDGLDDNIHSIKAFIDAIMEIAEPIIEENLETVATQIKNKKEQN